MFNKGGNLCSIDCHSNVLFNWPSFLELLRVVPGPQRKFSGTGENRFFYRLDSLSVAQPTVSVHCRELKSTNSGQEKSPALSSSFSDPPADC